MVYSNLNSAELFLLMEMVEKKINRSQGDTTHLWDMHFKLKSLWFATLNAEKRYVVSN